MRHLLSHDIIHLSSLFYLQQLFSCCSLRVFQHICLLQARPERGMKDVPRMHREMEEQFAPGSAGIFYRSFKDKSDKTTEE